jgi:predicted DNA-binding transcriptional regulator YafY
MDEVRVRYSPWLAPWIRERGPCEELPDGAVRVRFPSADPGWAVRHVLQYGAEAEIVEPHELREVVRETLESIARGA